MRTGVFTRASHDYGAALEVVKPKNNDLGDLTPPEYLDPHRIFTKEQWKELTEDEAAVLDIIKG